MGKRDREQKERTGRLTAGSVPFHGFYVMLLPLRIPDRRLPSCALVPVLDILVNDYQQVAHAAEQVPRGGNGHPAAAEALDVHCTDASLQVRQPDTVFQHDEHGSVVAVGEKVLTMTGEYKVHIETILATVVLRNNQDVSAVALHIFPPFFAVTAETHNRKTLKVFAW